MERIKYRDGLVINALYNNNTIIGYTSCIKNEIRTLNVETCSRRKGYGTQLLKKAEKEILDNKYQTCWLLAYSDVHSISQQELIHF